MSGFIYAIASGDAVKIGWSATPWRRFSAIKTGCPTDCELLGVIEGTADDERRLHAKFSPWRIRREWFRREGLVADFIATLSVPTGRAPRRYERRMTALQERGPLSTVSNVVEVLGGTGKVSQKLGKTPQSVSNWRARGMIPPELYLVISDLLRREGKAADPALFRLARPEAQAT